MNSKALLQPHVRALQVRMFAAWRRGCTEERYNDIGQSHIRNPMLSYLSLLRYFHDAKEAKSDEARIEANCKIYHGVTETIYKEALIALVRIERDSDDLDKIPNTIGALISQLRSHGDWRANDTLLELVDPDFAIIRNAIAHHGVKTTPRDVTFTNVASGGVERRVGPLDAHQFQSRLDALLEAWLRISNAFNYVRPPLCIAPIKRSLPLFRATP